MTHRTEKEMAALLGKFQEQIGTLDKWSDTALESLSNWLQESRKDVEQAWVQRDNESDADS